MEFPCNDCGMNTVPVEPGREYYELRDGIWTAAGAPGIGQSDNGVHGFYLCILCVEARLGFILESTDFKNMPANSPSPWLSDRLNDRVKDCAPWFPYATLETTPQYYPNCFTGTILRTYKPAWHEITDTGSVCVTDFETYEQLRIAHARSRID